MGFRSIGFRLAAGFALFVVLLIVVAATGVFGLRALDHGLAQVVENRYPKVQKLHEIVGEVGSISVAIRDSLIAGDAATAGTHLKRVNDGRQTLSSMLKDLDQAFAAADEESARLQQALHDHNGRYLIELIKLTRAVSSGDKDAAARLLPTGLQPVQEAYLTNLRKLVQHESATMKQEQIDARALYARGRNLILLIVLLALAGTVLLAVWLTRGITLPLKRAGALANDIAQGDLTGDIDARGRDETAALAGSLKVMQSNLVSTVSRIQYVAGAVDTASHEIAQGNHSLSARTEAQVSALEETAASIEQLTTTGKQTANNARQAVSLAAEAAEVAVKGGKVVEDVVRTMSGIEESSKKIGDILTVIDGIAFQTNILALNAAVEAARAGEQGRGFAVVASEVRALAQRSAVAAKEIKSLIGDSTSKVNDGARLVETAGQTMEEIVGSTRQVTELVRQIATANNEQSSGIQQVHEAVMHMEQATQQNASLVEEIAAVSLSMRDQAQTLMQAVSAFRLPETDGATDPAQRLYDDNRQALPAARPRAIRHSS